MAIAVSDLQLKLPGLKMIIGEDRLDAQNGATIAVEDPSDGAHLANVPAAGTAEVDCAVAKARATFESRAWSRMRPIDRSKLLDRIAQRIESELEALTLLETYDNGMPLAHARAYIMFGADTFRYMAGWCTRLTGKTYPGAIDGVSYHTYTQSVPVGVVGAIVPWNGPFVMAAWKIATALAAGCTIVLKPSELTPLTALRLGEIVLEAGVPAGACNIVTGYGHTAGQSLVDHPGVDKIAFTGSARVGKMILQSAAKDLKRVTLELGGKSPNIVFADADMDRVAPAAAMSIYASAGQACIAGSRLYVERKAFDKVVDAVASVARTLKVGNGRLPDTDIGPVISRAHRERIMGYIDRGISEGGKVVTGGSAHLGKGYYVDPTVFVDATPEATITREEIFGPVVVAIPFTDIEEVIRQANDTTYGLAAYVWTSDVGRAHQVANRMQAGSVWINSGYALDPAVPFGGFKQSGLGRELSEEGIRAYMETRAVYTYIGS